MLRVYRHTHADSSAPCIVESVAGAGHVRVGEVVAADRAHDARPEVLEHLLACARTQPSSQSQYASLSASASSGISSLCKFLEGFAYESDDTTYSCHMRGRTSGSDGG